MYVLVTIQDNVVSVHIFSGVEKAFFEGVSL